MFGGFGKALGGLMQSPLVKMAATAALGPAGGVGVQIAGQLLTGGSAQSAIGTGVLSQLPIG